MGGACLLPPPPHSSCSGRSCLMKLQKSPMNRQHILPPQWLNSRPEFKTNKSSRRSVSKIWWFPPIPDLNRTKNHNKTQTSDFHQSSLRKKNKIPVKITLDTLNPSMYPRAVRCNFAVPQRTAILQCRKEHNSLAPMCQVKRQIFLCPDFLR